jgi:hypothetical protein
MIKGKSKTKALLKSNKPEMQISLNTLYGSKYLLYMTNFALICIAVILCVISASIYFLMPVSNISMLPVTADIQEAVDVLPDIESSGNDPLEDKAHDETYTVIADRNIFSPQRKDWVVRAVIPKPAESAENKHVMKKVLTEKPKKIILHGIVIAGNIKKALINNPLTGISKNKMLYVEEGEEVEGHRVTSIESDLIRLDWQGEEIIVPLYSGLNGYEQVYEDDKSEEKEISILQDERIRNKRKSHAEVFENVSVNLMSVEPEERDGQ